MGKEPDKDLYEYKVRCLQELEALSQQGKIDLYYGDETGVSTEKDTAHMDGKVKRRKYQWLRCLSAVNG